MRTVALSYCVFLLVSPSFAAPTDSVATRLAAQNALFEEVYQTNLKDSPADGDRLWRFPLQRQAG